MTGLAAVLRYAPTLALRVGVRFVAIYAFTRLLSPEDYGRYSLLLTSVALVQLALFSWIEASAMRFFVRARRKGWLDHLTRALTVSAVFASLALALGVGVAVALVPGSLKPQIAACGVFVLVTFLANVRRETLRADERTTRFLLIDGAIKLGGLGLGILLAWRTDLAGLSPLLGVLLASVIVLLVDRLSWSAAPCLGAFKSPLVWQSVQYGGPLAFALMADQLLSAGDRFVIAAVLGEQAVGAYAAGYGVTTQLIGLIFLTVGMALSPAAIRTYETEGAAVAIRATAAYGRVLVTVAIPACCGLILVAEPLSTLLVGGAFREDAAWIMAWAAPAGLLAGLGTHYFSQAFALTRRTGAQAVIMIAAAALNVALNLLLIPRFGVAGALASTIASYAAALVGSIILGRRVLKLDLLVGPALRALLAAGLMAGVLVPLRLDRVGSPVLELLLTVGVGGLVYTMAAWLLGALDELLPNALRRAAVSSRLSSSKAAPAS